MNILYLATWFPYPLDNGSKIRVYHLLRALASKHDVTLLSFAFDTADITGAQVLREICADVRTVQNNPFERSGLQAKLRFLSLSPAVSHPVRQMTELADKVLRDASFDLVVASTAVTAVYALQAPAGTTRILEEHNSMSRWCWDLMRSQERSIDRFRWWIRWNKSRLHESRLFKRFDLCTMVSEEDRRYTLNALPGYGGPVEVVPNGVDCQHNRPGMMSPIPYSLVFNGSLTYDANLDAMRYFSAQVYPQVRKKAPLATLEITGSVADADYSDLDLDSSVKLTGLVSDVRPHVSKAWACVAPIRHGGGTRLKVLEALALGTPVVASSKAVEGYALVPEEHYLLADTPEGFAQQILRLFNNPLLREQLSDRGRRFVETKHDWEQIGQAFCRICENAVVTGQASG